MCNFKPGDLVLCIKSCVTHDNQPIVKSSELHTVSKVVRGTTHSGTMAWGLVLSDVPLPSGYMGCIASHFIRIDPENLIQVHNQELEHV